MAGAPAHRLPYLHHGSSPHTRGTGTRKANASTSGRFIPACAGNTVPRHACRWRCAVHPRMRGEHNESPLDVPPSFGAHASAGSACTEPDQCHRVQTIPDTCLGPRCRAPQSLRLDPGSQNLLRNDKASGQFPHRARTRPARHLADRVAHRPQNLRIGCTQLLSCTLQTRFVAMQINHCCCTTSASNASNPIPVPSGWALVTTSWGRPPTSTTSPRATSCTSFHLQVRRG